MNVTVRKGYNAWYVITNDNEVIGMVDSKEEADRYVERMDTLRRADEIDFDEMLERIFSVFGSLACEKGYEWQRLDEAEWIIDLFRRAVPEVSKVARYCGSVLQLCGIGWNADVKFEFENAREFWINNDCNKCGELTVSVVNFNEFGREASEFLMNCERFGFTFDDYRKRYGQVGSGNRYIIIGFEDGRVRVRRALTIDKDEHLADIDYVKRMIA